MSLVVQYRRDTRNPTAWRTRSVGGEAAEWLHKLVAAGRGGLRSDELSFEAQSALRFASIPTEYFTSGSEGSGMHRRIRISAGWSYRISEAVASAA